MRKFIAGSLVFVGISGAALPLHAVNNNIPAAHAARALDCSKQHVDTGDGYQIPTSHPLRGLSNVTWEGWQGGSSREFAVVIPAFPARYQTTFTGAMGIAYQTPASCHPNILGLVYQALVTESQRSNSWDVVFVLNVPKHQLVAEGIVDQKGYKPNLEAAGRVILAHIAGHHEDTIVSAVQVHLPKAANVN